MLASPVVANGIVYVGPGYDGKVYAFGSQLVDDFESGSFDAWTGTVLTSGETASVLTKTAYRGTHAARFTSNGGGGYENAFCNKTLTADELYVRGYFNVSQSGINSDNDRLFLIVLRSGSDGLAYAGWKRTAGATKWCITMRDGTSYIDTFSNLTTSPSTSRWYNVELHWKKDPWDGLAELWVDGSLVCSSMGRNTSAYSGVSRVQFGLGELYGCVSTTVYSDSARITNEHIGPEPKATSSLSIRLSSNVITLGQVALISGSLLPAKPSSNVSIKYHFNRVASWSNLTTVKTDASGNYSYDWAPAEVGSYEVRASWEGDEGTLPSQSQVITLDIDETTIPEIQAPMILPLMALATLLVTILTRRSSEHAIPSTARAYRHLLLAGHPTPLSRILQ
jgi:hypothetical protein